MIHGPNLWRAIALGVALIFAAGAWAERWKARRDRLGKRLHIYTVMQAFSTLQPDEVWRTRVTYDAAERAGDYVITVRLIDRRGVKLANPEDPSASGQARRIAISLRRPRDLLDNTAHGDVLLYPAPGGDGHMRIRIEARKAGEPKLLTGRNFTVMRPVQ